MKHYYSLIISSALLLACGFSIHAQESHTVTVSDFQFVPADLEINEGDTVIWVNEGGNHNVNGNQETFPGNPDSFFSGAPTIGWTYSYTFSVPGSYDYQCDAHSQTMTGTIEVSPSSNIREVAEKESNVINIYPNPTTEFINFDFSEYEEDLDQITVTIYNTVGALIAKKELKESEKIQIATSDFQVGTYTYQIHRVGKITRTGQFIAR